MSNRKQFTGRIGGTVVLAITIGLMQAPRNAAAQTTGSGTTTGGFGGTSTSGGSSTTGGTSGTGSGSTSLNLGGLGGLGSLGSNLTSLLSQAGLTGGSSGTGTQNTGLTGLGNNTTGGTTTGGTGGTGAGNNLRSPIISNTFTAARAAGIAARTPGTQIKNAIAIQSGSSSFFTNSQPIVDHSFLFNAFQQIVMTILDGLNSGISQTLSASGLGNLGSLGSLGSLTSLFTNPSLTPNQQTTITPITNATTSGQGVVTPVQ